MTARTLAGSHVRKAYASKGDDTTLSRWVKVKGERPAHGKPKQGMLVGMGNPSIEAGRSIFYRKGVKTATASPLVSGHSNAKIGRDVRKGHLRGYWIYTLSLEERATCPRTCAHWYDCYGNNMPFAKRLSHDENLPDSIANQLDALLAVRGRTGILVRLHALGDFYSVEYVQFWRRMLEKHPRLAVFGYTARTPAEPIGQSLILNRLLFGDRWMLRWSDAPVPAMATVSIISPADCPPDAFVCPEQTGRTRACATCAACWSTTKNVAFLGH